MAKISANGATEVRRIRVGATSYLQRSDNVILSKCHYSDGSSSCWSVRWRMGDYGDACQRMLLMERYSQ